MNLQGIESDSQPLFPLDEILNLIMTADKEKHNSIGELKQDAILEPGPDLPIVGVPVLQPQASGQGSESIQVIHQGIDGLIDFFLAGGRKFLKVAVKAGLKFVSHLTSSGFLGGCGRYQSRCKWCWTPLF